MKSRVMKMFSFVAMIGLSLVLLAGCGGKGSANTEDGKINVVTSIYPLYDFAVKIGGEHVHVVNIVPAGVEPHDWSPQSRDIRTMRKADLLLYQGAGLEGWIDDFLKSAGSGLKATEVSQGLKLLPASGGEEEGDSGHGVDPHTWLSPVVAKDMSKHILDSLVEADPAHKADYETNYSNLAEKFDELDKSYRETLTALPKHNIVVQHSAFGYLCKEYGLTQEAIMGLTPDAEPTAKKMKEIKSFVEENQVSYIFFEALVSDKLAKTLARDAHVNTLPLNPLEGLTKEEIKAGKDYFSVMNDNLHNLTKALQ
ncbi:metal ABC transporter substrate-binding protein [Gorillibacterium massiliense]|uniref:metal ABC transporter substrate-binding protein n=1 Tax=Gorillibacterium massiliense TaxID=1280390 RepID=UPI0004B3B809|nr:metal ABC transporter substrate-binding protein [Gorillibacterium massiliense]